jgi:hypothetical protein
MLGWSCGSGGHAVYEIHAAIEALLEESVPRSTVKNCLANSCQGVWAQFERVTRGAMDCDSDCVRAYHALACRLSLRRRVCRLGGTADRRAHEGRDDRRRAAAECLHERRVTLGGVGTTAVYPAYWDGDGDGDRCVAPGRPSLRRHAARRRRA